MAKVVSYEELSSKYKEEYGKEFPVSNEIDIKIVDSYRFLFNNLVNIKLKSMFLSSLKIEDLSKVKLKKLMLEEKDIELIDGYFKDSYSKLLLKFYQQYLIERIDAKKEDIRELSNALEEKYGLVSLKKAYEILTTLIKRKYLQAKINEEQIADVLVKNINKLKDAGLLNDYAKAILIRRVNEGKEIHDYRAFYRTACSLTKNIIQAVKVIFVKNMSNLELLSMLEVSSLIIELDNFILQKNEVELYDLIFNQLVNKENLDFNTLFQFFNDTVNMRKR